MNRTFMVWYAVFCLVYLGCAANTGAAFILEEPKTQSENNVDFSVDWPFAIRLYYNVKHIFLTVTVEYVMGNEQKRSALAWKFRPRVLNSSAFWDMWMRV